MTSKSKSKPPKTTTQDDFSSITVRGIPQDIMRHILSEQSKIKLERCVGQYSQSSAIICIIREHKQMKENKKQ